MSRYLYRISVVSVVDSGAIFLPPIFKYKCISMYRIVTGSGDGGIGKQAGSVAGSSKEVPVSQSEKRISKNEKKAEIALSSPPLSTAADEGKDGTTASSSGDAYGRVSSSGRVIKQTNKGRCFTAAREAAQNKQSTPATSHGSGSGTGTEKQSTVKFIVLQFYETYTTLTKDKVLILVIDYA